MYGGFQGRLQLGPHDAERRQSLGLLYVWSLLFLQSGLEVETEPSRILPSDQPDLDLNKESTCERTILHTQRQIPVSFLIKPMFDHWSCWKFCFENWVEYVWYSIFCCCVTKSKTVGKYTEYDRINYFSSVHCCYAQRFYYSYRRKC